jgi:hypothetical protein
MLISKGRSFAMALLVVSGSLLLAGPSHAQREGIYSPKDGSTLADSSVAFRWYALSGAESYALRVGTKCGNWDIFNAAVGDVLEKTVHGFPLDRSPICVELWYLRRGSWFHHSTYDYRSGLFLKLSYPGTGYWDASPAHSQDNLGSEGNLPGINQYVISWEENPGVDSVGLRIGSTVGNADYGIIGETPAGETGVDFINGGHGGAAYEPNGSEVWMRLSYKNDEDACTINVNCPYTDHRFRSPKAPDASDLVLAGVTWMFNDDTTRYDEDPALDRLLSPGNHAADPNEGWITQGTQARFGIWVIVFNEDSGGVQTFPDSAVRVRVRGSWQDGDGTDPNADTSFEAESDVEEGYLPVTVECTDPAKDLCQVEDIGDAGLYPDDTPFFVPYEAFNDLIYYNDYLVFLHPFYRISDTIVFYPNLGPTGYDMPALRDLYVNRISSSVRFVQNTFNNHIDAQSGYVMHVRHTAGPDTRTHTALVFTVDVGTQQLQVGRYRANVEVDFDDVVVESREDNNDLDDFLGGGFAIHFGVLERVPTPQAPEEMGPEEYRGSECASMGYDPYAGGKAATYAYVVREESRSPAWTERLDTFDPNGVSKATADEIVVGELWGPFGHICYDFNQTGDRPTDGECASSTDWEYGTYGPSEDLDDNVDLPLDSTACVPPAYPASAAEEQAHAACLERLPHLKERPNPGQIRNVIVFFPGYLGSRSGSVLTGQYKTNDLRPWDFHDENNRILYAFREDSLASRIVANQYAYADQYTPQDTLLISVFDPGIDLNETQDEEILAGLEELIAVRTNFYENVERFWIGGGSRGGSTAFYLLARIMHRFKGYEKRVMPVDLRTNNRIFNHGFVWNPETGYYEERAIESLKFIGTGLVAHSMHNDRMYGEKHFEQTINDVWNTNGLGHGNCHHFDWIFRQHTGDPPDPVFNLPGSPTFRLLQIVDNTRPGDPMLHCTDAGLNSRREEQARVPNVCDAEEACDSSPCEDTCSWWNMDPLTSAAYSHPYEGLYYDVPGDHADAYRLWGDYFTAWFPMGGSKVHGQYGHSEITQGWNQVHMDVLAWGYDKVFDAVYDEPVPAEGRCDFTIPRELACFDGFDNDGDGPVDCEDEDCIEYLGADLCEEFTLSCTCGAWVDEGCGEGACTGDEMLQTRLCSPAACNAEARCVYDEGCADSRLQLLAPANGTNLSSPASFQWTEGASDAYLFLSIFYYDLGFWAEYYPYYFGLITTGFDMPSPWWDLLGEDTACWWLVVGYDTSSGTFGEMAGPWYFQKAGTASFWREGRISDPHH